MYYIINKWNLDAQYILIIHCNKQQLIVFMQNIYNTKIM